MSRASGLREQILEAAVDLLSESGSPGLTQPKVCQRVGITQSHLTYYFPTRSDLVTAVAETVVSRLLDLYDSAGPAVSADQLVDRIALIISSTSSSRALLSLILAADTDPAVLTQTRRLIDGLRIRASTALTQLGARTAESDPAAAVAIDGRLLHAAWVGLAVTGLGEGDTVDRAANREAIARLVHLLGQPK
jgi:AcrR family transcriptional regulator